VRNTCYLRVNLSTYRYNFNTGEYLGAISLSGTGISVGTDGSLYTWSSTTIRRYNSSGVLQESWAAPGGTFTSTTAQLGNGFVYAAHTATNGAKSFAYFKPGSGTVNLEAALADSVTTIRGLSGLGNRLFFGGAIPGLEFAANWTMAPTGTFESNRDVAGAGLLIQSVKDTAPAHNGRYFGVGQDLTNPANGLVVRYDDLDFVNRGSFGSSVLKTPVSIASVVAPEPGTMIALSLAFAAICRRKRGS